MGRGKRYEGQSKINLKKVFGVIIALIVIVMSVISFKKVLSTTSSDINNIDVVIHVTGYDTIIIINESKCTETNVTHKTLSKQIPSPVTIIGLNDSPHARIVPVNISTHTNVT